jgi:hypothetical protein
MAKRADEIEAVIIGEDEDDIAACRLRVDRGSVHRGGRSSL